MRTVIPLRGTSANTAVQLGLAKIASATSVPTLRSSMSNAAATSISVGSYPPKSQCIRPTLLSLARR